MTVTSRTGPLTNEGPYAEPLFEKAGATYTVRDSGSVTWTITGRTVKVPGIRISDPPVIKTLLSIQWKDDPLAGGAGGLIDMPLDVFLGAYDTFEPFVRRLADADTLLERAVELSAQSISSVASVTASPEQRQWLIAGAAGMLGLLQRTGELGLPLP